MSVITAADLEVLVDLFEHSEWQSLQLELNGVRISLSKVGADAAERAVLAHAPAAATVVAPCAAAPQARAAVAAPPVVRSSVPEGWVAIRAPNLGTFYRSPKPGSDPYVQVGQQIEPTTEVCLLEVMKLFTAVRAGVRGVVREVLVSDGELVEHDQPLILVEPRE